MGEMEKHQWIEAIASFRREYELDAGEHAAPGVGGAQGVVEVIDAVAMSQNESTAPLLTPTPWLRRAALAARDTLIKAQQAGAVRKALLGDWAPFEAKGRDAVRVVLRNRVL